MKKLLIIPFWLACSFFNWGFTLGEFTYKFPYMNNVSVSVIMSIAGPFAIPAVLIGSDLHLHWQLKPTPFEERWQIFHKQLPLLSREYFEQAHAY